MKNTRICPKCESDDILRVTDRNDGTGIYVGIAQFAHATRFLCANCGYMEHWMESKEDREKVRKRHKPW